MPLGAPWRAAHSLKAEGHHSAPPPKAACPEPPPAHGRIASLCSLLGMTATKPPQPATLSPLKGCPERGQECPPTHQSPDLTRMLRWCGRQKDATEGPAIVTEAGGIPSPPVRGSARSGLPLRSSHRGT